MAMVRQEDSLVMLSAGMHLDAHRERPFAATQGDMQVGSSGTTRWCEPRRDPSLRLRVTWTR
jgi:hypothetical protein